MLPVKIVCFRFLVIVRLLLELNRYSGQSH